jgi:Protein of unknown function (DUF2778)
MAYAAATSRGVRPFRTGRSSNTKLCRTALSGVLVSVSFIALTAAAVGSAIAAAGWMMASSVASEPRTVEARHPASQLNTAMHETSAEITGTIRAKSASINAPKFDLMAENGLTRTSVFNPMGALALLPERVQTAVLTPPKRPPGPAPMKTASLVDIPMNPPKPRNEEVGAVPLPRVRPAAAAIRTASLGNAPISRDGTNAIPSRTAIYDIEARTVYMPNGERLEAHSGLGDLMDNPRHVNVRMRGATPPNTYTLTLRESMFHGVQAIRLNPVDEDKMFGRDGILAHTYMLGASGASNGCVSFKHYNQFLQAFKRGEVDRMIVVSRLSGAPIPVAASAPSSSPRSERYAMNSRKSYSFMDDYGAVR